MCIRDRFLLKDLNRNKMARYDVVIVGAGLFGSLSAYKYKSLGRKVLVIDKRSHVGGNLYCESIEGINVHKYGAHIFHTSNKKVWDFVNSFVEFNRFTNSPLANYKNVLYNLPFNMNTFYQLWGTKTPAEAKAEIERQRAEVQIDDPKNLEEQALSLVGKDIYEKLIKGYTEKQWGKSPRDLPAFIIKRIPLRYTFDNNYFSDIYQGIPAGGYNGLISKLLEGCEVLCNADFFKDRTYFEALANQIVYTGRIDEYFTFSEGHLDFRSLYFEQELLDIDNYQGNAVINYTDADIPYTRIIEHKHFEFGMQPKTVITREYPISWQEGADPYYPINDERNTTLFEKYKYLADREKHVCFGGRLAEYKYYDMNQIVEKVVIV